MMLSDDRGIRERVVCTDADAAVASYRDMVHEAMRLRDHGITAVASIGILGDVPQPLNAVVAAIRAAFDTPLEEA
jgi:hypothetical protein